MFSLSKKLLYLIIGLIALYFGFYSLTQALKILGVLVIFGIIIYFFMVKISPYGKP